jgi:hypothetical protein
VPWQLADVVGLALQLVMCNPSQLSAVWFADDERTIATSIGTLSNMLGSALGFLIAPCMPVAVAIASARPVGRVA